MPITYVTGDATLPNRGDGPKVIVHCCNDEGYWGAGFVLALSAAWPKAEIAYRAWSRKETCGNTIEETGPFELGHVQFVGVEVGLWVANLIGQHGINISQDRRPPVRYDAIQRGLVRVCRFALSNEAAVHMPRMGAGLAGGRWDAIAPLLDKELCGKGVPVTVYDLP